MMSRFFSFLDVLFPVLLLLATPVAADDRAAPKEEWGFHHYFAIEPEGSASYYVLTFPSGVYQANKATHGRDVRIIDAEGHPVPYAFGGSIEAEEEAPKPFLRSAPWFPLPDAQSGKNVQDGFIIADDGTLRVRERPGEVQHRSGDIVDLSKIANAEDKPPRLSALFVRLDVSTGGTGEYLGSVEVLASDDLQRWRRVTTAQLLRLDHRGQQLKRERIDFEGALSSRTPRYLQLRWLGAPPIIASIEAELLPPRDGTNAALVQKQSELQHWREKLPGQAQPEGDVFFDTGGVFPVDRLRFHLPRLNTVVSVKLYSRADENASWRQISTETLYRLQGSDGAEQETPEIKITPNRDRFWRIAVENSNRHDNTGNAGKGKRNNGNTESPELGGMPQLSIGWRAEAVTFLARGTPPFLLAAGNAKATDASIPLAQLLVGDKPHLAPAKVGATQPAPANAPVVHVETPQQESQTRRIILWGVLLGIVALLAFMAWKLARHLPQGEESD